jgi:3'-phosphoadenosine 5'-phosphosulfate sulfotransferase (PAPS reductase)/FAD synthetase
MNLEVFPKYIPFDRQSGLHEVMSLSGGRSSAFTLMCLINGGFGHINEHHVLFENTGEEDETCYKFLYDIQSHTGINITWLEYTLTPMFASELLMPNFSYDDFYNCKYSKIEEILNVEKLRSYNYTKSPNNFWYTEKFSDKKLSIKQVDYFTANRNGKPFADVFLYKCAIRIMKGEGILLPSVGQRWCTGDMKEKVGDRWLANSGIREFISYKGMRHDEQDRVLKVKAKNNKQDKIWYDCPMDALKINKVDVLIAWASQPFDLGLKDNGINIFNDVIGNCKFCHLKTLLKKMYLIQKGYTTGIYRQIENLANNYNGDIDAMSRSHGTMEHIVKKALSYPEITLNMILSDAEKQVSCFGCGD